jgi:GNAT superfamily N-acetyltransferase
MAKINVLKVMSQQELGDFIRLPRHIYKDCQQYVPDMESDVRYMLDEKKNPVFKFSRVQPFIAYQDNQPVGRIVGIINQKANERWQTKNVRFSMIEFVDDEEVSAALIEAVCQWGQSFGMDKIEGPLGITDFDKEGMLVEDFHLTGTMNTIYNPEYYPRHIEKLGFRKETDWLQIRIQIPQEIPPRYARVAQYVQEQMGLRVIKLTDKDIYKRGYGKKVFGLLNEAYRPIFGFSELSEQQVKDLMNKYLKLLDKQMMPVVVNEQGEVVGVAITIGCLSEAMKKAKGRLWPTGWWHLLKAMKWRREESAEMLLVAVRPDYQGMGVNALFFSDLIPIYNKYGFRWAETGPQLEDNVRELSQWKPLNPAFVKRRRCYIKNL